MKCKVCGKRFRLKKENKYIVKVSPHGLACLTDAPRYYEAFDCPKCGCQKIVNIVEVGEKVDAEGLEIEEDDYINFEEEEENGNRNNDNMYHGND